MTMSLMLLFMFFVLGVVMLWLGLRGRRVDDHPLCRKCGFDLTGRPAGSDKCSECGADLTAPRAIRHGHRRRRPVMLGLGLAVVLLFVGVAGVIGWSRAREFDRYQVMPTWYLLREARNTSGGMPVGAWQELSRRLGGRALSGEQIAAATAAALAIQGDRAKPWHAAIGNFVEAARKGGDASDTQWARYARQAGAVEVTFRPQVRRAGGDDLPVRIATASARVGNNAGLVMRITDPIAGRGELIKPPDKRHAGSGSVGFGLYPGGGGASTGKTFELDDAAVANASPGAREATVRLKLSIRDARNEEKTPLAEWEQDFTATWELVDADTIKLIDDESHRAAIEKGTTVTFLGWRAGERPDNYPDLELDFKDIPVTLAHKVVLRAADGREWKLTTVTVRGVRGNMRYHAGGTAKSLDVDTVDVIFRPDPHAARHTVDVTELWNHEFVVRNVRVQRPAAAAGAAAGEPARPRADPSTSATKPATTTSTKRAS